MSVFRRSVELSPPEGSRNVAEVFVAGGFACPYCNGRGWHLGDPLAKEAGLEPCARCGGTGRLRARVTVEWLRGTRDG